MTAPVAWLGMADERTARVCAWCPDKDAAEALAKERGVRVTHGCCDACCAKEMAVLEGVARQVPAPLRVAQVARDITGDTFPEIRGAPSRCSATVTRPVRGDTVHFFLLRVLAEQLAMESKKLASFFPRAWRTGEDMIATEHGVAVRESSLSGLVAELSTSGQGPAALVLMRLLTRLNEPPRVTKFSAGSAGTIDCASSGLNAAERTTGALARAHDRPPKSRLLQWEDEHQ